jgi:hypothetical protein
MTVNKDAPLTKSERKAIIQHMNSHFDNSLAQYAAWARHCLHKKIDFDTLNNLFIEGLDTKEINCP